MSSTREPVELVTVVADLLKVLWVEMLNLKMVLAGKTITQYIQAVTVVYFNV